MTLYRIDYDEAAGLDLSTDFDGMPDPIRSLIDDGVLVEVEPTTRICTTHDHLEIKGRGFCLHGTETDRGDGIWEFDCYIVDVWIGEPS